MKKIEKDICNHGNGIQRHLTVHKKNLTMKTFPQVWINYAQFESSSGDAEGIGQARAIYERGNNALRHSGDKEERVMLLEAWREFETQCGDDESRQKLAAKLPRRTKKRVRTYNDEGVSISFKTYRQEIPSFTIKFPT